MKFIDPAHPFYRPVWRRIVIVAVLAGWLLFEIIVSQSPLWIAGVAAALAYSAWVLLIAWPRNDNST